MWMNDHDLECLGLNIILAPQMSFTIVVIYRPPSSDVSFYEKFENLLKESNLNKETIILGDTNINWEDTSCRKNLKKITDKFDLVQMIKGPTRITTSSSTQIDLAFTNRPERIIKSYNMLAGLSDHNLILVARKLSKKRFGHPVRELEYVGIPKNQQEGFKSAVQQIDWDHILLRTNCEMDCESFIAAIERTIKNFSCNVKRKKNILPWMSSDILKLMKERDLVLKNAIKTKSVSAKNLFTTLRNKTVKAVWLKQIFS